MIVMGLDCTHIPICVQGIGTSAAPHPVQERIAKSHGRSASCQHQHALISASAICILFFGRLLFATKTIQSIHKLTCLLTPCAHTQPHDPAPYSTTTRPLPPTQHTLPLPTPTHSPASAVSAPPASSWRCTRTWRPRKPAETRPHSTASSTAWCVLTLRGEFSSRLFCSYWHFRNSHIHCLRHRRRLNRMCSCTHPCTSTSART